MAGDSVDFKLYRYNPSLAAAIIFIVLFFTVTALHFYQMLRTRTWIFIPFVVGGVCTYSASSSIEQQRSNKIAQLKSLDT